MPAMYLRIATCQPLPEIDPDEELLLNELRRLRVYARMAAWNDPTENWDEKVPTVVRSTWDYIHNVNGFRVWMARVERAGPLWNPKRVIKTNLHKRYLFELESRGIAIAPTELLEVGGTRTLEEILRARGWTDVVIKPAVGAGSFATRRFRENEIAAGEEFLRASLTERDMLVQGYLESVDDYGERALVWIDGEFTHAVRKSPRFSGQEESVSEALAISDLERAIGNAAIDWCANDLLYARVDVARGTDDKLCVMELELIEPSLFLKQNPRALTRLAEGIASRLGRR